MISAKIPFENKGGNLTVVIKGGTHPYQIHKISESIFLKKWKKNDEILAPEWAEEIIMMSDNNSAKFICRGLDFFIDFRDHYQRVHRLKGWSNQAKLIKIDKNIKNKEMKSNV